MKVYVLGLAHIRSYELTVIDAISSTVLHPSGLVVATCSGSRHNPPSIDFEGDLQSDSTYSDNDIPSPALSTSTSVGLTERNMDNSLKFWAVSK